MNVVEADKKELPHEGMGFDDSVERVMLSEDGSCNVVSFASGILLNPRLVTLSVMNLSGEGMAVSMVEWRKILDISLAIPGTSSLL